jgi:hypothetical protein
LVLFVSASHSKDFGGVVIDASSVHSEVDWSIGVNVPSNKSLHPPPDASVTALAFATAAPDAGACELKR